MPNRSYKVSRGRKHGSVWPVLLLLVAAVALALLISGVWQVAEGKPFFPPSGDLLPAPKAVPVPLVSDDEPESEKEPSSSEESSAPESLPEDEAPELPVFDGAVPESEAVDQSYFDDAVFVGDSITEGMTIYSGMSNAKILAYTGINFSTIETAQVIKQEDGTRETILNELAKAHYNKVYVMLGGNEVGYVDKPVFIKQYEAVLDKIVELQPGAVFYVQSMTPVTENNKYNLNNERIDEYNQAILELCQRKGLYYLNVAESMKDSRGMLPTEASPMDGMHFAQEYFDKWFAYLKTHTVAAPAAQSVQDVSSGADETQKGEKQI